MEDAGPVILPKGEFAGLINVTPGARVAVRR
jgi:hypothetical protein